MKLSVSFATLALALAAFAQDNKPTINTPVGVQQCSPTLLMISGGTPPYDITAIPVGQPAAPPLATITTGLQGNTFTWKVNLQGGTSVTLQVRDSTGAMNFSNEVDIQNGPDNSCLSSSAGGSTSAGGSPTSAGGSPTSAGGSPTSAGGSPTSAGGSSTSGTSAPSPSAPTSSSPSSSPVTAPSTPPTSAAGTTAGGTTSPASRTTSGTGTNTAAAQQTSNAAVGLASGSAAGVVGALLAYVLA